MSRTFTDTEFDTALHTKSDCILPSSGFTDSVMASIQNDALAPPQISFPWKRAVPGFVANAVMLSILISAFHSMQISATANFKWDIPLASVLHGGIAAEIFWLLLSTVLACLGLLLTRRLGSVR